MMHVYLMIGQDQTTVECSWSDGHRVTRIPRPMHISRVRWQEFWRHLAMTGITKTSLAAMERFMQQQETSDGKA
jgi:hypothetical protein